MDLAVFQCNSKVRGERQPVRGPVHLARSAVGADCNIVRRWVPLAFIVEGIEENGDAPRNPILPMRVIPVGNRKASSRPTTADCRRSGVLQNKCEPVGSVPQPALPRQL